MPNDRRPSKNPLGKSVRLLREAQYLRQDELAEMAGISKATISRIERGEGRPSFKAIQAVAKALSVDPETLVQSAGGDEEPALEASGSPNMPAPKAPVPPRLATLPDAEETHEEQCQRAWKLLVDNKLTEASDSFADILRHDAEHPLAKLGLAAYHVRHRSFSQAREYAEQAWAAARNRGADHKTLRGIAAFRGLISGCLKPHGRRADEAHAFGVLKGNFGPIHPFIAKEIEVLSQLASRSGFLPARRRAGGLKDSVDFRAYGKLAEVLSRGMAPDLDSLFKTKISAHRFESPWPSELESAEAEEATEADATEAAAAIATEKTEPNEASGPIHPGVSENATRQLSLTPEAINCKIFISHSQRDVDFVRRLAAKLSEAGYDVFKNFDMEGGQDFRKTLADGLRDADVTIVVISENSLISHWVLSELGMARAYAGTSQSLLLPLVLDGLTIPPIISDILAITIPDRNLDRTFKNVLSAIRSFFSRRVQLPWAKSEPSVSSEPLEEVRRLVFPPDWRFGPGATPVPPDLLQSLRAMLHRSAESAEDEKRVVEAFKRRFGDKSSSTNLDFAYGDLEAAMRRSAENGAVFAEAVWLGFKDAERLGAHVPSIELLNTLFRQFQFGYKLAPPELLRIADTARPVSREAARAHEPEIGLGGAPAHVQVESVSPETPYPFPDPRNARELSDVKGAPEAPTRAGRRGDPLHDTTTPARDEHSAPDADEWTTLLDSVGSASDAESALDAPDPDKLLAPSGAAHPAVPLPAAPLSPLVTPASVPGSAEAGTSVAWDSRTVTLTITATSVRLDRGRQITAGAAPIWSREVVLDWAQAHFVDESDHPCTLDQALDRLPLQWSRPLVERFGQELARLLFGDPLPAEVVGSLILPSGETRRLLLVLDAEHQRVPWEYLRIGAHFLAEQQLSIVRHVETISKPMPLVVEKPRTILFAYANPGGDENVKYDGDAHKKKILDALGTFQATVTPAELCTAAGLEKLLRAGDGQVFHFLGHGVAGGTWDDAGLVVHGEPEGHEPCPAERIGLWMRDRRRSLAVLGACYGAAVPRAGLLSSVGGRIVHTSGTPVVAMQMEVPQAFSTAFVERFYRELPAAGFNIEISVFLARRAQCDERHLFGIPVLLADARGLDKVPDLRRPPGESPRWAQFVPVAALTSQDAVAAWSDLPADIARAAVAAIQKNAESDPSARYPQPSDDPSQLPSRVAQLHHAIRDPEARSSLAVASAAAPAPEPFALTSGVIEPLDELPLAHRLNVERCQAALKQVHADFSLPDGLVARIVGELRAGKHVMLTGPVGTGKTSIAQAVVRALGYDFHLDTASADWTRFEILGGFMPTPRKGELHFTFRPGVFLEAVRANWSAEPKPGSARVTLWRRVRRSDGKEGVWLILDELNRADMDRALGGIFTALETRLLRVPTSDPDGGTVEIPIPEDFRVIATMNAADRHFLFRLSDALKRRFAFVHVPVTVDWDGEWTRLRREARIPDETNADDLRRFVALVRMFHPLGSALVLAALRLYATSDFHITADPEWPLTQAIEGALLPNLEDLSHAGLVALHTWSETASADRLAQSLLAALPQPSAVELERRVALAALPRELSPQHRDGDERPPETDELELVAAWIARRVARPLGSVALPRLGHALLDLIRHAPHA